jgi:riboflavin kinase / FMN adenylyltransferase
MEVFAEGSYPTDAPPSAVTVGVYDGVHLGHRHVLSRLGERAAEGGLPSLVVTFDPHPASVVDPDRAPAMLCTLERRLELLDALRIDRCVVVRFDAASAAERAESFVARVLVDKLHASVVVVGENFRFGHEREGDVELLARSAQRGGFVVEPVSLDATDGAPITSSRIRDLVARGDVAAAAVLLGRPHELEGVVARGDGRGRSIGYPTANLDVDGALCRPAVGIYAGTWTRPDGERAVAAISVGRRPTFHDDADVLVEAYLCDFDADLYGERGRLAFVERLRDEERFESVDALVRQIALDVEATRAAVGR